MMNCQDVRKLLSMYIDRQLDGIVRRRVSEHLEACEECRKELFDLNAGVQALNNMPSDDPGDAFNAAVLRRLQNARREGIRPLPNRMPKLALGFAVICVLIAILIPAYVANMDKFISRQEIYVLGTGTLVPGSKASMRVVVADGGANNPVSGARVRLMLRGKGANSITLISGKTDAAGTVNGTFQVPDGLAGNYKLIAVSNSSIGSDTLEVPVTIKRQAKVMVTTDKPIYQPGQTIHIRTLALLRPSLKPAAGDKIRIVIEDPSGNKICDESRELSEWGVSSVDFQLADEIGLGEYKIKVVLGDTATYKTVNVKRYVLPKFKVTLSTDRTYYVPGQTIKGTVSSQYFFGKPAANASVSVELSALGAQFDEFGHITGRTNAQGIFTFQAKLPNVFAGQPVNQGNGVMGVSVKVTDTAEHTEQVSETFPVASSPIRIALVPESGNFVPELENTVYVVTSYPDGRPAPAQTTLLLNGKQYDSTGDALGVSAFKVTPKYGDIKVQVTARTPGGSRVAEAFSFADNYRGPHYYYGSSELQKNGLRDRSKLGSIIVRANKALYDVGDTASIAIVCTKQTGSVYIDAVLDGQTVLTQTAKLENGRARLDLDLSNDMAGTLAISAYTTSPVGVPVRDTVNVLVRPASQLNVTVTPDKPVYRPGDNAKLGFLVTDSQGRGVPAAVGVNIVDESVFSVEEQAPGLAALYFALQEEILKPRYQTKFLDEEAQYDLYRDSYRDPAGTARRIQQILLDRERQSEGALPDWNEDRACLANGNDNLTQQAAKVLFAYASNDYETSVSAATQIEKEREIKQMQRSFGGDRLWLVWVYLIVMTIMFAIARRFESLPGIVLSLLGLVCVVVLFAAMAGVLPDWLIVLDILAGLAVWLTTLVILMMKKSPDETFSGVVLNLILILAIFGLLAAILFPVFSRARECARKGLNAPVGLAAMPGSADAAPNIARAFGDGDIGAPPTRVRQFFPETLYSNPAVITDGSGRGSVDLTIADSITSWRISAIASSKQGEVGSVNAPLKVFQEFFVDLDLPVGLTQGDAISVPVAVYNYLPSQQTIGVQLKSEPWFEANGGNTKETTLGPNGVGVVYFPIRAKSLGRHSLTVLAQSGTLTDAIKREITVYPNGQETSDLVNGVLSGSASAAVDIPAYAIPGASKLFVKIYPGALSQVVEGLDALLQVSHGCFEQTSSITYPNVLILKYLEAQNKDLPKIRMKAEQYISLGYQRLLTFEVDGGGFDWYGNPPANTILTAYGIMELSDMADVATVDRNLITRASALLESRQEADGNWPPDHSAYTWEEVSDDVTVTAYVTWALCEGGFENTQMVRRARGYLTKHASSVKDTYTLALLANALVASGADARDALARLSDSATIKGDRASWRTKSSTLTYGSGSTAGTETTALAAYAFLKSRTHSDLATKALNELVASRDKSGAWQTTQATILALKALLESSTATMGGPSDITLTVNGRGSRIIHLSGDDTDVATTIDLSNLAGPGRNTVSLKVNGEARPAYQVLAKYYVPWSRAVRPVGEKLKIDVSYSKLSVGRDATVDVVAKIKSNGTSIRMAIVDLGLPPGFAPDQSTFEALKQKRIIDRFEITPRQIILYLRDIGPGDQRFIRYKLRALYPVRVTVPSSIIYDYYNPEGVRANSRPLVLQAI